MHYRLESTIGDDTRNDDFEAPNEAVAVKAAKRMTEKMAKAASDDVLVGYLYSLRTEMDGRRNAVPVGTVSYYYGLVEFQREDA